MLSLAEDISGGSSGGMLSDGVLSMGVLEIGVLEIGALEDGTSGVFVKQPVIRDATTIAARVAVKNLFIFVYSFP